MKNFTPKASLLAAVCLLFGMNAKAGPTQQGGPGAVTYNPTVVIAQGSQPMDQAYPLDITSPANLTNGVPVTVTLGKSMLSSDNGVDAVTALTFLSFASPTVTFTGPNQVQTVMVSVTVPLGEYAGNYAYRIQTDGWPSNLIIVDPYATVNALVEPAASIDTTPPSVVLQSPVNSPTYTYYAATGIPVSVPLIFNGSVAPGGAPIGGLQALVNGNVVAISTTGIGSDSATGSATLNLTTPGLYAVRVSASNTHGSSEDTGDFTVVLSAPPPSITVSSPSDGASYTYFNVDAGASVLVSYSATSEYGNIISTSATLNGSPIVLNVSGVGASLTAVGSASLTLAAGNYELVFNAANDYGAADPVAVPFTVHSLAPVPFVTILSPVAGTEFTRTAGDPATDVNYTFTGGTTGGVVESVSVSLDGVLVASSVVGINTDTISGSGSAAFSVSGTHTLSVTVSNGQATATDVTTFTINESSGEVCQTLTWLPPISLNKTVKGGRTMPIKFRLDCEGVFVEDTSTLIAIYEIFDDGSISEPTVYPYGVGSPNAPDYAITGNKYHLNFVTAEGQHRYKIEVFHPLNAEGTSLQLLGSKELLTKGKVKSEKSKKSKKSEKSMKSSKSHK